LPRKGRQLRLQDPPHEKEEKILSTGAVSGQFIGDKETSKWWAAWTSMSGISCLCVLIAFTNCFLCGMATRRIGTQEARQNIIATAPRRACRSYIKALIAGILCKQSRRLRRRSGGSLLLGEINTIFFSLRLIPRKLILSNRWIASTRFHGLHVPVNTCMSRKLFRDVILFSRALARSQPRFKALK
jgi:hypothetical protein